MTGTIAAWGQAEAWGWERREELAQALAQEATDWFEDVCPESAQWAIVFRVALALGSAGAARECRLSWARAAVDGLAAPDDSALAAEERETVSGVLASACHLGSWDWVVGASSVYLDGELVETPERGAPGERCSCGGTNLTAEGEGCEHLILAAILKGAHRHRRARAVRL